LRHRKAGSSDAQGADTRFNFSYGLTLDVEENLMVSDFGNNAIRRVTMTGEVSTVAVNGEKGFADGAGAVACFKGTNALVVDGEDVIVVADTDNHRQILHTLRHPFPCQLLLSKCWGPCDIRR
jgi:hypothetical protein